MPALLILALALQVRGDSAARADTAHRKEKTVTIGVGQNDRRREPRRIPVTEEHRRTAFKSRAARDLLERAREARLRQDSALVSYDAMGYLRISAGLSISRLGRDRLIFRHENAARIRWHRDVGAWIDVKGARTVIPIAPEGEEEASDDVSNDGDMTPLPYYPGYEPLFSFDGSDVVEAQVDDREFVHPLAGGSEAYYQYAVGDSVTFRLPNGNTIQLRELDVRPRVPRWNVVVGSLWFDVQSGQLVRAAYRLAVPMDIWATVREEDPEDYEEIPIWVRGLISPMRAQLTAIAVEYGLYEGRFWLPRLRSAEGSAQISFMRAPMRFEQSYRYASVNGIDSLPAIQVVMPDEPPDSLDEKQLEAWRDSVQAARIKRRAAERDSIRKGLKDANWRCDSTGVRLVTRRMREPNIAIANRVPCDRDLLWNSPELPKSIYDDGEETFGSAERDALIKQALAMGAQPPFAIGRIPPEFKWGLQFTRFNRVEGFSTGALVEQPLGAGYTASLFGRVGHADLEPNAELALARTNLTTTVRLRGYNRLMAANDWGNPLSFGSSLSGLLFGRDEGFYYRASGVELEWLLEDGSRSWRLFAERQRSAAMDNTWSLGAPYIPNISASTGQYAGAAARLVDSFGLDVNGFRAFSDLRLETGVSDSSAASYGRGALDLTFTRGLGAAAAALTVSAGASAGSLPPQRRWYLGGPHTVRGQWPDTATSGNAYWLGRLEVGRSMRALRPVVFGDIGWVGDRDSWREVGRPLSGAGVGASLLDGLIRFDIARGFHPEKRIRLDLYLEAKF